MKVNIILFDDFETLDVFGPVEVLGRIESYKLNYISLYGGVVTSRQGTKIITQKMEDLEPTGTVLIPGGQGTRTLVDDSQFIKVLRDHVEASTFCLAVCTGSALLAKTGLIDNLRATSNKKAFEWVQSVNNKVNWIQQARWVVDGKYYTSSGVSAGIDMSLAFIADQFNDETAQSLANDIEYIWHSDATQDPFA